FVQSVMLGELIPGIPYSVDEKIAQRFGFQVLDRFRNPFIEHRWLAITMQYSAKMQMRNVPTLLHYYQKLNVTPRYMAIGFAAYLLFMRATHQQDETWYGEREGGTYPIYDDQAGYFAELWGRLTPEELTTVVLRNTTLWGFDLTQLPGFAASVANHLTQLVDNGIRATLCGYFTTAEAVTI
ncbi:MAG TPA: altronate oxidoreductase, partial [Fibrella sp.]